MEDWQRVYGPKVQELRHWNLYSRLFDEILYVCHGNFPLASARTRHPSSPSAQAARLPASSSPFSFGTVPVLTVTPEVASGLPGYGGLLKETRKAPEITLAKVSV